MGGMIICIDPGSKKAGVALFETDGKLMTAWLSEGKDWRDTADCVMRRLPVSAVNVSQVVVERMQHYPESPVPVEDLITLSLMAGRVGGIFRHAEPFEYLPRTWKKQVPKKILIERIKAELTKSETSRVKGKQYHDVWDAVGIGLYHLRVPRRARVENLRKKEV
jgi:hypothetical protein